MNYAQSLSYLEGLSRFGMRLGLSRITALLDRLGNPQNQLRFIHIAGTNGKGSVSTMLANALQQSGYRTGLFTSPYVLCFRERMQINGEMIPEHDFAACADRVRSCIESMALAADDTPTQFEFETAVAFCWYAQRQCDIVCLEVGLGGRFDSTNVILPPLLQVVTAIGLDHTDVLGETLSEIAFEKAGIIKGGMTVLYPIQDDAVHQVIKTTCRERGSNLHLPDLSQLQITDDTWLAGRFSYKQIAYQKSLLGHVQIYNALTVITAVEALRTCGFSISDTALQYSIETTHMPARLELLSQKPLVLLDGAHNPDGARGLVSCLSNLPQRRITLIMGVLQDKNYEEILKTIAPYAHHFVALTPDNPRALPAQVLATQARAYCPAVSYYEDFAQAVQDSLAALHDEDVLLACGSLYLASALRPLLQEAIAMHGEKERRSDS